MVTPTVQGYRGGNSGYPVHPSWNPGQWGSGLSSVSWAAPTTKLGFSKTQNESVSSTPPVFLGQASLSPWRELVVEGLATELGFRRSGLSLSKEFQ